MRLLRSRPVLILLLLPFLEPETLRAFPLLHSACTLAKAGALFVLLTLLLLSGRVSPYLGALGLLHAELLLSTWMNGGNLKACLMAAACNLGVSLLAELAAREDARTAVRTFYWTFGGLSLLNLCTLPAFPDRNNGLLGYQNMFITVLLPAVALAMLWEAWPRGGGAAGVWLLTAAAGVQVLWVWSAASMVAVFLLLAFVLFLRRLPGFPLCNMRAYCLIAGAAFLLLVILRRYDVLEKLIVQVLRREMTFSSRIYIWDAAMREIASAPLLGHGYRDVWETAAILAGGEHAHNLPLDLAHKGGAAAAALFLATVAQVSGQLMRHRKSRAAHVLSYSLFVFFILFLVEAYPSMPLFYLLLTLGYHVGELREQAETARMRAPPAHGGR